MMRIILLFLIICFASSLAFSQESYRAGTLTQINLNAPLGKKYKLNTKLEARQIFSEKEIDKSRKNQFRYERTDLYFVVTRKVSADNTVGLGYLVRLEEGKLAHRFIQQFNTVHEYDMFTLAHRFVLDETFRHDQPLELRLRYRVGLEKSLNGQSIDPREFYLKINNEYLAIWSNPNTDLEIRASAALGYNIKDNNKVELGLEYRINEFYKSANGQQFWITIAWYYSI